MKHTILKACYWIFKKVSKRKYWPGVERGLNLLKQLLLPFEGILLYGVVFVCYIPVVHSNYFLGTDVSPFPNFNNSVLTTRRNLLLHCWTHQYVTINPNFSAYVLQSIRLNGWFRGRVVNSWFWISYFLRSRLIWIYIVFKTGHYQAAW